MKMKGFKAVFYIMFDLVEQGACNSNWWRQSYM